MIDKLKRTWKRLRESEPGRRFRDYHDRRRESGGSPVRRALWAGVGVVLLVGGVVLLAIPGPGIPILFLGGGLLARESRLVATAMDTGEVWLRKAFSWGMAVWRRVPLWGKALIVALALAVAAAAGLLGYRIFFAG